MAVLARAGLPIHLSEITITSPGDDEPGGKIQAVIARNSGWQVMAQVSTWSDGTVGKAEVASESLGEIVKLRLMRDVKRPFDPNGILNPGKSLPD